MGVGQMDLSVEQWSRVRELKDQITMIEMKLRDLGQAKHTDEELRDGIWTMTDAEYKGSLRDAYDSGFTDCNAEYRKQADDPNYPIMRNNPYEERKMTPAEIDEWRRTCPYPEALGK